MALKKSIIIFLSLVILASAFGNEAFAQRVTNGSYQTVAYIKSDGTIQDDSYRTIGHIKSDGTVQDGSYRTIGYAKDIPKAWAAWYFFFSKIEQ